MGDEVSLSRDMLDIYVVRAGSVEVEHVRKSANGGCFTSKVVNFLKRFGLCKAYCGDIITIAGLQERAANLAANYCYVQVGTGTTTPTRNDVALEHPYGSKVSGATSVTTTVYTNDTAQIIGTVTASSDGLAITEAGLFNAANVMYSHQTFSAINLNNGDMALIVFKIQKA